jgi:hypothetical protein
MQYERVCVNYCRITIIGAIFRGYIIVQIVIVCLHFCICVCSIQSLLSMVLYMFLESWVSELDWISIIIIIIIMLCVSIISVLCCVCNWPCGCWLGT